MDRQNKLKQAKIGEYSEAIQNAQLQSGNESMGDLLSSSTSIRDAELIEEKAKLVDKIEALREEERKSLMKRVEKLEAETLQDRALIRTMYKDLETKNSENSVHYYALKTF